MNILINGQIADITLENEKSLGEVLQILDRELAKSGAGLNALAIDGQAVDPSNLSSVFSKDINTIQKIEIQVNSSDQLFAQALIQIYNDILEYENLDYAQKTLFFESWKTSTHALFSQKEIPDIYELFTAYTQGSINMLTARSVLEERLREIAHPEEELASIKKNVDECCARLLDLPVDMQTGKDRQAAQTIQLFSGIAEKIIRISKWLILQNPDNEESIKTLFSGFGKSVKEILEAYKKNDTVMTGDIAEYEIAPSIKELYSTMLNAQYKGNI
jgi:hypothetical protein